MSSYKNTPPACRGQREVVCSSMQLSLNFGAVLESEYHPAIVKGCGLFHHRQPEALVKFSQFAISLGKGEHEPADGLRLHQPLILLLLERIQLGLRRIVPGHIDVVAFSVFLLTLGALGVLLDTSLGQLRHHLDLLAQCLQLGINGGAVGEVALHQAAIVQQGVSAAEQLVEGYQEPGRDVLLQQMGRPALFLALELSVALPDSAAVLAVGVPHLGAVEGAAVATDDVGGK